MRMRYVMAKLCVLLMMPGIGSIGHAQGTEENFQSQEEALTELQDFDFVEQLQNEGELYRGGRPGAARPGGGASRPSFGRPGGGIGPGSGGMRPSRPVVSRPAPSRPGSIGQRPVSRPGVQRPSIPQRPVVSRPAPSRPGSIGQRPVSRPGVQRPSIPQRPGVNRPAPSRPGNIGQQRPVRRPGVPQRPGVHRPTRPHGSFGKYHRGGWHNRPGWSKSWRWNFNRYPSWWYPAISLPVWVWVSSVPVGYWQCTAFDEDMNAFSELGRTRDEAAYNALYECGGGDWDLSGCYVPEEYCRIR